ncbi:SAM-dependent methyltransferase [Actinomadura fulvescens]|uniref:SAM-dependent methyltransferase n=1 Tax=Actinomadura fulvescens TaxID=46160 RepID=A0ABN3QHK1_9ACTN
MTALSTASAHAYPGSPGGEVQIDTLTPHPARVWNYWLGGKDNYPCDRHVGDACQEICPNIVTLAQMSRHFMARAIGYLATTAKIGQFLVVGTDLPNGDDPHTIAQRITPAARVVYADTDPLVLTHARALLTSNTHGVCDYLDADLHHPAALVRGAATTLNFGEPVAIVLRNSLDHLPDQDAAHALQVLLGAAAAGSHLAISHLTGHLHPRPMAQLAGLLTQHCGVPWLLRTPTQIAELLDRLNGGLLDRLNGGLPGGLRLVDPGVVSAPLWRPEPSPWPQRQADIWAAVGCKR